MEIKSTMGNYKKSEETQMYSLKWNDFERQLLLSFANLYVTKEFADCTLICDEMEIPSHKIVLSMCSPYFRQILKEHSAKHPTIIIDGVSSINLNNVLEFIYVGKVSVKENQIQDFIETAEFLCVDGIETKDKNEKNSSPPPSIRGPEPSNALNLKRRSKGPSPGPGQDFDDKSSLSHFNHFIAAPSLLPPQLPLPNNSTGTATTIPSLNRNAKNVQSPSKTQSQPLNLAKKRLTGKYRHATTAPPTSLLKNPVEDNNNNNSKSSQKNGMEANRVTNSPGEYQLSIKPVEPNIQLFTTPSGMIVTTAYGLKPTNSTTNWPGIQQQLPPDENSVESSNGSLIIPNSASPNSTSVLEYSINSCSSSCCCSSQLRSTEEESMGHNSEQYLVPTSTDTVNVVKLPASHQLVLAANRLRTGKINQPILSDRWTSPPGPASFGSNPLLAKTPSGAVPQPLKYTAAQVRALVDSVTNVSGPFVPCKLCDKVVKRERLRAHIYECHLVNGAKIQCPFCCVYLKSKGSYRVHVWRHRKGSLKNPTYNTNTTKKIRNV